MRVASFFVVLAALNVSTGCAKPALSRQRVPRSPLGQTGGSIGRPNEIKVPSRGALDTNIEVSGGQTALPVSARDGCAAPLMLFIPPTAWTGTHSPAELRPGASRVERLNTITCTLQMAELILGDIVCAGIASFCLSPFVASVDKVPGPPGPSRAPFSFIMLVASQRTKLGARVLTSLIPVLASVIMHLRQPLEPAHPPSAHTT